MSGAGVAGLRRFLGRHGGELWNDGGAVLSKST